jgi:hypothetical protein
MMQEQAEEMLARFEQLVPKTRADKTFVLGVAKFGDSPKPVPFVALREESSEDSPMPPKFIAIFKVAENEFAIRLYGFTILVGVGIRADRWPFLVTEEQLDAQIIDIWEKYFQLQKAIAAERRRLMGPGPEDTVPL